MDALDIRRCRDDSAMGCSTTQPLQGYVCPGNRQRRCIRLGPPHQHPTSGGFQPKEGCLKAATSRMPNRAY